MVVADLEHRLSTKLQSRRLSPTLLKNLLQTIDPIVIASGGFLAYYIYELVIRGEVLKSPYIATILIGACVSGVLFNWAGVYKENFLLSKWPSVRRLLITWSIVFASLLFIAFALKITSYYSRVWVVSWFFGGATFLFVTRLLVNDWAQKRNREGVLAERVVIYGAGEEGQRFAAHLDKFDQPCIKALGFVDDRKSRVPSESHGYALLGDREYLLNMIRSDLVDQVYVALPWSAQARLTDLINQLAVTPVQVFLVAQPPSFEFANQAFKFVGKVPVLEVFNRPLTSWSYLIKAIEDRLIAFLILMFVAPLMSLIALAIKIDSPGPVLFRQERYGFNNNQIEVLKFRTMYKDENASKVMRQATRFDPRITRVGRFLRKSSLDELPQLLNVLRGDMSVVGPRPHAVEHTYRGRKFDDIIHRYAARHRVKPGITGWAQVNGWRGETDTVEKLQKRVEYDLYYVENWSVWFDLWIIVRTIFVIFKDDNAF